MKFHHFCFIAVLVSLASCAIDPIDEQTSDDTVIRAYFADTNTKTTFADDFGFLSWSQGDKISVFSSSGSQGGYEYIAPSAGETVDFEPVAGSYPSASVYYAVYPYSDANSCASDGTITAIIPSEQVAISGNISDNTLLTVGKSSSSSIGFYHVSGGVRFTVKNADITKVIFKSNNNEPLSGTASIKFNTEERPHILNFVAPVTSVTLSSESSFVPDQYYYISMAPAVLQKGFTMEFYKGDTKAYTTSHTKYIEVKRGVFSSIKQADDLSSISKIKSGKDLSDSGKNTANCYVISEAGDFKIPAVKGNSGELVGAIKSAEVVWETPNTAATITKGSIIASVDCSDKWMYFSTPATFKEGNALIAAKDANGSIIWSWHIWCVKDDPTKSRQYLTNGSAPTMDRNLGALSKDPGDYTACGLFYQWGRKDPFIGPASLATSIFMSSTSPFDEVASDEITGTLDYAISHPNTFIYNNITTSQDWMTGRSTYDQWASDKTIYDPCPSGWKVPVGYDRNTKTGQWYNAKYTINTNLYGANFTLTSGTSWYPCPGYMSTADPESLKKSGAKSRLMMTGQLGYYWSSTVSGTATILEVYMESGKPATVRPTQGGKVLSEGRSVRCVAE